MKFLVRVVAFFVTLASFFITLIVAVLSISLFYLGFRELNHDIALIGALVIFLVFIALLSLSLKSEFYSNDEIDNIPFIPGKVSLVFRIALLVVFFFLAVLAARDFQIIS